MLRWQFSAEADASLLRSLDEVRGIIESALAVRDQLVHGDEDAVRAADRSAHQWRNPVWRHHDGSLAEW